MQPLCHVIYLNFLKRLSNALIKLELQEYMICVQATTTMYAEKELHDKLQNLT